MHQETTTIINAEELLGDFFDPGSFHDNGDGFEMHWEWPEELGNGFTTTINIRQGLMLGIGDYQLHESIAVCFGWKSPQVIGWKSPPVIMAFNILVSFRSTPGYRQAKKDTFMYNSGQSFISYLPEWQGLAQYPARTPVRTVVIFIDPLLLNTFMEGQHDHIPNGMCDIVNGADDKFYYQQSIMTPPVNMIIHQILNCPYQFPFKRLYLEGKILELISQSMAQFVPPETVLKKPSVLQMGDIERVREARNVLIRNLENPPSLFELARQVGINKNKLNQGFHQVFGTSVFDYLRIRRLEQARQLLESKKKNVTEAAFDVGYAHQENFTRAFKNHFGTNPKDHLR